MQDTETKTEEAASSAKPVEPSQLPVMAIDIAESFPRWKENECFDMPPKDQTFEDWITAQGFNFICEVDGLLAFIAHECCDTVHDTIANLTDGINDLIAVRTRLQAIVDGTVK